MAKLQPGDELDLNGTKVSVVQAAPASLTLHVTGKNETQTRAQLPASWALAIAQHHLDNSPPNQIVIAAFLAIDPEGDRARARKILAQQQQSDGDSAQSAGFLLSFLSNPYLQNMPTGKLVGGKSFAKGKPDAKDNPESKDMPDAPDSAPRGRSDRPCQAGGDPGQGGADRRRSAGEEAVRQRASGGDIAEAKTQNVRNAGRSGRHYR